jgi:hypothetical protein
MRARNRYLLLSLLCVLMVSVTLAYEVVSTRPVRQAVRAYTELMALGNRDDLPESERLAAARVLCSQRFRTSGRLRLGPEGGIAGLPRTINKNFQAWREGPNVWICPTNRVGPVYQFVFEDGRWRFDGLVGILRRGGEIVKASEVPDVEGE